MCRFALSPPPPRSSFLVGPCEEVMSMQFLLMDGVEFLAVGVGQPLSEGVETGGRLLLLRLPQLVSCGQTGAQVAAAGYQAQEVSCCLHLSPQISILVVLAGDMPPLSPYHCCFVLIRLLLAYTPLAVLFPGYSL